MSARPVPGAWPAVLGPNDAEAGQWDVASGVDPARLRACAQWCEGRAGELDELAGADRRVLDEFAEVLPSGPGERAGAGRDGIGRLAAGADALRRAAEVLDAGARAVETIRGRHVGALEAALAPGEPELLDDAALEELRTEFVRSCSDTAAAMRRVEAEVASGLAGGVVADAVDHLPAGPPGGAGRGGARV